MLSDMGVHRNQQITHCFNIMEGKLHCQLHSDLPCWIWLNQDDDLHCKDEESTVIYTRDKFDVRTDLLRSICSRCTDGARFPRHRSFNQPSIEHPLFTKSFKCFTIAR